MEHRMRNISMLRAAVASTILIGFSSAAHGQSEPQKKSKTAPAQAQQPASRAHKVWTEDNLSSVRTPADSYVEAKDRQAANSAVATASAQPASDKQSAANSQKPAKTPPLAHAKSVDDA